MTYLAILRDNMTNLNYVFAADSISQVEKASFDCIQNESGFLKKELVIRDYAASDIVFDKINSTGTYLICCKDFKYENFCLTICIPNAFKLI